MFNDIHRNTITYGDFVGYTRIFGSLLFDDSYDNKLLQLTDFIAGSFAGVLAAIKRSQSDNSQMAIENFSNSIYPRLCEKRNGDKWGAGIKETPKDKGQERFYENGIIRLVGRK